MANARYFQQSFPLLFWQNVVDFNAEVIAIPWTDNGFAFENGDGTYTAFFGANVVVGGNPGPVSGVVEEILRLSSINQAPTIGTTQAQIAVSLDAFGAYVAYQGGGDAFFATVFSGPDTIEIDSPPSLGPLHQSPLIEAYAGNDVVTGSSHADTIFAGAGSDEVRGRGGDDTINGGPGLDFLFGGDGSDEIFGGDDHDEIRGGDGSDTIEGGSDGDEIDGEGGHDTTFGNGGDDDIDGGRGTDNLYGGNGNDTIFGGAGVFIDLLEGGNGTDTLVGGGGSDTIRGGSGVDTIDGGTSTDSLFGGSGHDIIYGRQGDDFIQGGNGDDHIRGGAGFDTVTFNRRMADYDIDFNETDLGEFVTVTDLVGNGGSDDLFTVERINFADGMILV